MTGSSALFSININNGISTKNNIKNGRPAKLYRFKELESNIDIF